MTVSEQFFASMKGRIDQIGKAILTAKTGDTGRKVIKLLETYVINNNGFVSKVLMTNRGKKYLGILQYLYGYHGFDNKRLTNTPIKHILKKLTHPNTIPDTHKLLSRFIQHYRATAAKAANIHLITDLFSVDSEM